MTAEEITEAMLPAGAVVGVGEKICLGFDVIDPDQFVHCKFLDIVFKTNKSTLFEI